MFFIFKRVCKTLPNLTILYPKTGVTDNIPCSPWWPFPYLVRVGLVLLLHSFRSRATSWVTPTPAMSSFICWCHVFLGRPRRLVPGIASSITLRVTLVASRLWTCPNQRRRPLRMTRYNLCDYAYKSCRIEYSFRWKWCLPSLDIFKFANLKMVCKYLQNNWLRKTE